MNWFPQTYHRALQWFQGRMRQKTQRAESMSHIVESTTASIERAVAENANAAEDNKAAIARRSTAADPLRDVLNDLVRMVSKDRYPTRQPSRHQ